jgi:hypothetical protein
MNKILMLFLVKCGVAKDIDIVAITKVCGFYVDEQAYVIKNNGVVHNINYLLSITLRLMTLVLPRLPYLN